MGLITAIKRLTNKYPLYLYTEKELEEYEAYIEKSFGKYDKVFHEMVSPDVHLDIIWIPASDEYPYHRLITMGAGAYKMKVPKQFKKFNLERAEYVINLPKEWNIESSDEKDYWPIKALKDTARLPIWTNSWLANGHTLQPSIDGKAFSDETKLNNIWLLNAVAGDDGDEGEALNLQMSSGKNINFYLLFPIYQEELQLKIDKGRDALMDLLIEKDVSPIVNVSRENVAISN